jgi:hypothetical protein
MYVLKLNGFCLQKRIYTDSNRLVSAVIVYQQQENCICNRTNLASKQKTQETQQGKFANKNSAIWSCTFYTS